MSHNRLSFIVISVALLVVINSGVVSAAMFKAQPAPDDSSNSLLYTPPDQPILYDVEFAIDRGKEASTASGKRNSQKSEYLFSYQARADHGKGWSDSIAEMSLKKLRIVKGASPYDGIVLNIGYPRQELTVDYINKDDTGLIDIINEPWQIEITKNGNVQSPTDLSGMPQRLLSTVNNPSFSNAIKDVVNVRTIQRSLKPAFGAFTARSANEGDTWIKRRITTLNNESLNAIYKLDSYNSNGALININFEKQGAVKKEKGRDGHGSISGSGTIQIGFNPTRIKEADLEWQGTFIVPLSNNKAGAATIDSNYNLTINSTID